MTINTHMSEEKMRGTAMNIIFSFALQSLLHPFLRPTLYSSPYNEVLISFLWSFNASIQNQEQNNEWEQSLLVHLGTKL